MDVPGSPRPFPCVDLRLLRAQASLTLVYGVWAAQGHRAVSFSTSWYPSPKSYLTPPFQRPSQGEPPAFWPSASASASSHGPLPPRGETGSPQWPLSRICLRS